MLAGLMCRKRSVVLLLIAISVLIVACSEKVEEGLHEQALGEWIFESETYEGRMINGPYDPGMYEPAFQLKPKGVYESMPGGARRIDTDRSYKIHRVVFDGQYEWNKDTILVKSMAGNDLLRSIVEIRSRDTLILRELEAKCIKRFVRADTPSLSRLDIDRIEFTSSPCYGICPVQSIIVRRDGTYEYTGEAFTRVKGTVVGAMSPWEIDRIFHKFLESRIDTLESDYTSMATDQSTVWVEFYHKGTLVSKIKDYGRAAPYRFVWAYSRLLYFGQTIDTTRVKRVSGGRSVDILREHHYWHSIDETAY